MLCGGVTTGVDRTQRQRCHHRCLVAAVPDKTHKAWPLASLRINNPDCFKFFTSLQCSTGMHCPQTTIFTVLSEDIEE